MLFSNHASASPADIQRKRDIAQKLLLQAQQTQPKNIGEGLGAVGDYIYAGRVGRSADDQVSAAKQAIAPIADMLMNRTQSPEPAAPQESYMPDGVSVAQMAPPPGVGPSTMPQAAPQVQPFQQQQQPDQNTQMRMEGGRMLARGMSDQQLFDLYTNPEVMNGFEIAGMDARGLIKEELARRWDYMTEQQKMAFQRSMQKDQQGFQAGQQERGFDHDRGMVGLRTSADLEKTAIEQGYSSVEEMLAAGGTRASQKAAAEVTEGQQKVVSSARSGIDVLTTLESLYNDEGIADITGPLEQWRGTTLQSEKGNRALTKHNQVQGQAFLEAFERLKGGGPITDIEGKKGTEAIQRINRALTEREYRAAVQEFFEITQGITIRRLQAAGVPEEQWPAVVRNGLQQQQQEQQGGWTVEQVD